MDGKCTVTEREAVPACKNISKISTQICQGPPSLSQLQTDPEVLKRKAGGEPCLSDQRGKQGQTQWTLSPSSGKGFRSLAE